VYVFVLATSMLVTVIGLSVLTVTQINNRSIGQSNDTAEAELLAEDAVEYATSLLAADSNWRTTYSSGSVTAGKALGHGTISFKLVDETDGNLANNTTDTVRIYGYGRVNNATRIYSLLFTPSTPALTCLQVAIDSVGTLTSTSSKALGNGTLATNSNMVGSGGSDFPLEAAGTIDVTGGGKGIRYPNMPARTFPDASTIFSTYTAAAMGGTTVNFALLPMGSSPTASTITHRLISPNSNPWGSTNAKGIYIINCAGNSVSIKNSRIAGTLVFLNANTVYLETGNLFEPAVNNYPVLLVQGNLQVNLTSAKVTENSPTPSVNFNPDTTPYPLGTGGSGSNGSTSDSFSQNFSGLAYASGNLSFTNQPSITGVFVAGGTCTLTNAGSMTLNYDSTYYSNPPPGFTGGGVLTAAGGSWRWETAP
jgi:hypothetical protein